jgi:ABA sandwich protein
MTPDDIRSMSDDDLSAWVAEKVHGWTPVKNSYGEIIWWEPLGRMDADWEPCDDWNDAMLGVEKIEELKHRNYIIRFEMTYKSNAEWNFWMSSPVRAEGHNPRGPRAITEGVAIAGLALQETGR